MNYTEHYQLSHWAKDDRIQMEDFNSDNAKIDAALHSKASAATVSALSTRVGNLESGKADQTALEAETAARTAGIAALAANLGTAGHNCRIAFGSYVGDGTYGADNARVISCDFIPQIVMVAHSGTAYANGYNTAVFIRGMEKAYSAGSETATLEWGTHSLTYYSTNKSAAGQLNAADITYHYVILGYDAAAEAAD